MGTFYITKTPTDDENGFMRIAESIQPEADKGVRIHVCLQFLLPSGQAIMNYSKITRCLRFQRTESREKKPESALDDGLFAFEDATLFVASPLYSLLRENEPAIKTRDARVLDARALAGTPV